MGSLAALANHDSRIRDLMITDHHNTNGVVAMTVHLGGIPYTCMTDDLVPLFTNWKYVYARRGPNYAMYPLLMEKCFAKVVGTYEALDRGW